MNRSAVPELRLPHPIVAAPTSHRPPVAAAEPRDRYTGVAAPTARPNPHLPLLLAGLWRPSISAMALADARRAHAVLLEARQLGVGVQRARADFQRAIEAASRLLRREHESMMALIHNL